jgi:hypothetical protein
LGIVATLDDLPFRVRLEGLSIREYARGQTNVCTFSCHGTIPELGQEIKIGDGDLEPDNLLFAGYVAERRKAFDAGNPLNLAAACTCYSYDWLLNRRPVIGQYPTQSASAIVSNLITTYCIGFPTPTAIESGLPSIAVNFDSARVTDALNTIADMVGAEWYLDVRKNLHFYVTPSADVALEADDLLDGANYAKGLEVEDSIVDLRTWINVRGRRSSLVAAAGASDTALFVADSAPFVGATTALFDDGTAASYTGVSAGGGTTTIPWGTYNVGTTILAVASLSPFSSAGGWVEALGGQRLRYTGTTTSPSNRLTGIPAAGEGAIRAQYTTAADNSDIATALPALTGVSLGGSAHAAGASLQAYVGSADSTEGAYWAAQFGIGDGYVNEGFDKDLIGTDAQVLSDAILAIKKVPTITIRFETRNKSVRAGRSILVRVARLGIDTTMRIQAVTFDDFAHAGTTGIPRRTVEAASQYLRFEQYLRALKNL